MVQPEAGEELGNRKAANILSTRPDAVTTGNPGCLLQIARYLDGVPLFHPIELIDASIRGVNPLAATTSTLSDANPQTPQGSSPSLLGVSE